MQKRPLVILVIILIIAAVVGFLVYKEYKNRGEEVTPRQQSSTAALGAAALVLDSDGDGLKDWEEELWKTDIHNPDTDGDGTSDSEEIKIGRNPLRQAPNDELDKESVASKVNPEAKKNISDTERFARELFASYLSMRREGVPLSQNEINSIVETVSTSVPGNEPTKFTEKDIEYFTEEADSALRNYGNALGTAFKKPWPSRENELDIFERAVKDPNAETAALDIAHLTPISIAYNNLAKAIAKIPAPNGALAIHIRAANSAAEVSASISDMGMAFDDQVRAFAGVARYFDATQRFSESINSLKYYLQNRNVLFSEKEDGFALWKMTNQ